MKDQSLSILLAKGLRDLSQKVSWVLSSVLRIRGDSKNLVFLSILATQLLSIRSHAELDFGYPPDSSHFPKKLRCANFTTENKSTLVHSSNTVGSLTAPTNKPRIRLKAGVTQSLDASGPFPRPPELATRDTSPASTEIGNRRFLEEQTLFYLEYLRSRVLLEKSRELSKHRFLLGEMFKESLRLLSSMKSQAVDFKPEMLKDLGKMENFLKSWLIFQIEVLAGRLDTSEIDLKLFEFAALRSSLLFSRWTLASRKRALLEMNYESSQMQKSFGLQKQSSSLNNLPPGQMDRLYKETWNQMQRAFDVEASLRKYTNFDLTISWKPKVPPSSLDSIDLIRLYEKPQPFEMQLLTNRNVGFKDQSSPRSVFTDFFSVADSGAFGRLSDPFFLEIMIDQIASIPELNNRMPGLIQDSLHRSPPQELQILSQTWLLDQNPWVGKKHRGSVLILLKEFDAEGFEENLTSSAPQKRKNEDPIAFAVDKDRGKVPFRKQFWKSSLNYSLNDSILAFGMGSGLFGLAAIPIFAGHDPTFLIGGLALLSSVPILSRLAQHARSQRKLKHVLAEYRATLARAIRTGLSDKIRALKNPASADPELIDVLDQLRQIEAEGGPLRYSESEDLGIESKPIDSVDRTGPGKDATKSRTAYPGNVFSIESARSSRKSDLHQSTGPANW